MRSNLIIMGIALLAVQTFGLGNKTTAPAGKPTQARKAGKVPKAGVGPEPPQPSSNTTKIRKSNFRSNSRSKPTCKNECLGDQRCRHIRTDAFGMSMGECVGIKCAGVKADCGPCYKEC